MKSKRNTYLLIGLVLIIWGLVIYQLFGGNDADNSLMVQNEVTSFQPKEVQARDTFSISTFDRDPFLGTFKTRAPVKRRHIKPPEIINWPNIVYKGTISNSSNAGSIYIVEINGMQHLLKKGAMENEVKLLKGTAKQITVSYQKQKKKIVIQQ